MLEKLITGFAEEKGRQTMEEPDALTLVPGESVMGEMFVTSRDVRIRGFQWVGGGRGGKLVLTSYRLFYCFYDHRVFAFALEPSDVTSIELVPATFFSISAKVVITAQLGGGEPRRMTFRLPKSVILTIAGGAALYQNPYTPEQFAALLRDWHARRDAPDDAARVALLAQKRRIYAAVLVAETKAAFVRVLLTLPLATCFWAGPVFGFLARRDVRRLHGMASGLRVAPPSRVLWVQRLGTLSLVLGFLSWATLVVGLFSLAFLPQP
jgi:hypothetical protein